MKKAVIVSGSRQYLVSEDESLHIDLVDDSAKTVTFAPILVIDDEKIHVGTPELKSASVSAEIVEAEVKAEKVTSIRYKAKKRVHKVRGHRQKQTLIKVKKITLSPSKS